jgi:hypothetical protein
VNHEGLLSYFAFLDEDLMRSSSLRNSAVSSSIDLEGGLGGKGITSDIGRTSLGTHPRRTLSSRKFAHFCGAGFFAGSKSAIKIPILSEPGFRILTRAVRFVPQNRVGGLNRPANMGRSKTCFRTS